LHFFNASAWQTYWLALQTDAVHAPADALHSSTEPHVCASTNAVWSSAHDCKTAPRQAWSPSRHAAQLEPLPTEQSSALAQVLDVLVTRSGPQTERVAPLQTTSPGARPAQPAAGSLHSPSVLSQSCEPSQVPAGTSVDVCGSQ